MDKRIEMAEILIKDDWNVWKFKNKNWKFLWVERFGPRAKTIREDRRGIKRKKEREMFLIECSLLW